MISIMSTPSNSRWRPKRSFQLEPWNLHCDKCQNVRLKTAWRSSEWFHLLFIDTGIILQCCSSQNRSKLHCHFPTKESAHLGWLIFLKNRPTFEKKVVRESSLFFFLRKRFTLCRKYSIVCTWKDDLKKPFFTEKNELHVDRDVWGMIAKLSVSNKQVSSQLRFCRVLVKKNSAGHEYQRLVVLKYMPVQV